MNEKHSDYAIIECVMNVDFRSHLKEHYDSPS